MTASTPTLAPTEPPTAPTFDADDHGGRFTPDLAGWYLIDRSVTVPASLTLIVTPAQYARIAGEVRAIERDPRCDLDEPDGRALIVLSLLPDRPVIRAIVAVLSPDIRDMHDLAHNGERTRAWMEAQS